MKLTLNFPINFKKVVAGVLLSSFTMYIPLAQAQTYRYDQAPSVGSDRTQKIGNYYKQMASYDKQRVDEFFSIPKNPEAVLEHGIQPGNRLFAAAYIGNLCAKKGCSAALSSALGRVVMNDEEKEEIRAMAAVSYGKAYPTSSGFLQEIAQDSNYPVQVRDGAVKGITLINNPLKDLIALHKVIIAKAGTFERAGYDNSSDQGKIECEILNAIFAVYQDSKNTTDKTSALTYLNQVMKAPKTISDGTWNKQNESTTTTSRAYATMLLAKEKESSSKQYVLDIANSNVYPGDLRREASALYDYLNGSTGGYIGKAPYFVPSYKDEQIESGTNQMMFFIAAWFAIDAIAVLALPNILRIAASIYKWVEEALPVAVDEVVPTVVKETVIPDAKVTKNLAEQAIKDSKIADKSDLIIPPKDTPFETSPVKTSPVNKFTPSGSGLKSSGADIDVMTKPTSTKLYDQPVTGSGLGTSPNALYKPITDFKPDFSLESLAPKTYPSLNPYTLSTPLNIANTLNTLTPKQTTIVQGVQYEQDELNPGLWKEANKINSKRFKSAADGSMQEVDLKTAASGSGDKDKSGAKEDASKTNKETPPKVIYYEDDRVYDLEESTGLYIKRGWPNKRYTYDIYTGKMAELSSWYSKPDKPVVNVKINKEGLFEKLVGSEDDAAQVFGRAGMITELDLKKYFPSGTIKLLERPAPPSMDDKFIDFDYSRVTLFDNRNVKNKDGNTYGSYGLHELDITLLEQGMNDHDLVKFGYKYFIDETGKFYVGSLYRSHASFLNDSKLKDKKMLDWGNFTTSKLADGFLLKLGTYNASLSDLNREQYLIDYINKLYLQEGKPSPFKVIDGKNYFVAPNK